MKKINTNFVNAWYGGSFKKLDYDDSIDATQFSFEKRNYLDQIIWDYSLKYLSANDDEDTDDLFSYSSKNEFTENHIEKLSDLIALIKLEKDELVNINEDLEFDSRSESKGVWLYEYIGDYAIEVTIEKEVTITAYKSKKYDKDTVLTTFKAGTLADALKKSVKYIENLEMEA